MCLCICTNINIKLRHQTISSQAGVIHHVTWIVTSLLDFQHFNDFTITIVTNLLWWPCYCYGNRPLVALLLLPAGAAALLWPCLYNPDHSPLSSALWVLFQTALPTSVWSVAWGKRLSSSSKDNMPMGFCRNRSSSGRLSSYSMTRASTFSFRYSSYSTARGEVG